MTYFAVFELVVRFLVVGFFFVTAVPIPEPDGKAGKVLEVVAARMLALVVLVDEVTMVIGIVIAEEPTEVVVVLV
jgi:hypothetical protein